MSFVKKRLERLDRSVLALLKKHDTLTPVAAKLDLAGVTIRASIKRLIDAGLLEKVTDRHGNKPATYRVKRAQ